MVVGVDVKNTFDSVPHEAVIQRAKQRGLGVRDRAIMRFLLQDRNCRVRMGATLEPNTASNVGVPQRSVHDPSTCTKKKGKGRRSVVLC